ncbi:MAG: hypothetical protein REJ23_04135 [Brevundimonas sp.]|nr:hypothetical protein [Brevundimonas sp.]
MFMLIVVLALVALQSPLVVDGVIVSPRWVETAPAELLIPEVTEWPGAADAELLCSVLADGALRDCSVERSDPHGDERVVRHALHLSRFFRLEPRLADGRAVEGLKVRLRLKWES